MAKLTSLLDHVDQFGKQVGIEKIFSCMPPELKRAIVVYVDSDFTKDMYFAPHKR